MKFEIITEKEYNKFWESYPYRNFLSYYKISKIRKLNNWNIDYVGILKNKKIIAAAMLLSKVRRFNQKEYYSPRGILVDYTDYHTLEFFIKNLKQFIKNNNGFCLRIDPYIINKQRDINGDVVNGGIDNHIVFENLKKCGFYHKKLEDSEQDSWMFTLPINSKSEDEIFSEMKPNTRTMIHKVEKSGIVVRELNYDELDKFQDVMKSTGERKNFKIKPISYYQNMYNLFYDSNEVKFLIAELNIKDHIKLLEDEKAKKEDALKNLSEAKYNDGKRNALINEIDALIKKINRNTDILNKEGKDIIPLAASMFLLIKPEVIYLFSGNYDKFMDFNSQYLIQWIMIKYAINNGYNKYNFYGIPAYINTKPKDYGIYEFKKGFNGQVEELIGEFILPINKYYYINNLINKLSKIKNTLINKKNKI